MSQKFATAIASGADGDGAETSAWPSQSSSSSSSLFCLPSSLVLLIFGCGVRDAQVSFSASTPRRRLGDALITMIVRINRHGQWWSFRGKTYLNKTITFAQSSHWIYRKLYKLHLPKWFKYLETQTYHHTQWIVRN
jgi:hypothetical protein